MPINGTRYQPSPESPIEGNGFELLHESFGIDPLAPTAFIDEPPKPKQIESKPVKAVSRIDEFERKWEAALKQ